MTGVGSEARRARRQLASLSRPAAQFEAKRYFRGDTGLGFYNVGTTAVRGLARSIVADHRGEWTVKHAQRFGVVHTGDTSHSRNPAIVAVMKFASVPANIARSPRRARS